MRVLIDINILLDFQLQRELFFQDAEQVLQVIDSAQIVGYATATTLTDIFRLLENTRSVMNKHGKQFQKH